MKRILIKNLGEGECKVSGFIERIRSQKSMQFIILRDVSGAVQITVEKEKLPEIAEVFDRLTVHSFVSVKGRCVFTPFVKMGGKEIIPEEVTVVSVAEVLPIADDSSSDLRMDYRWIDLRDEKKYFIFKVATAFEKYATEWFIIHDFIGIHTPKITAISSEGGSEVFEIKDYFGQKAYLTQSPQLYKQMSMSAGFDRTFEIGECFRADPSFTSRHVTEFTAIDVEISHIDSHEDVMNCEEQLLTYVLQKLNEEFGEEFKKHFGKEMVQPPKHMPRIPLLEVYRILKEEKNHEVPRALKGDLDPDGEKLICEYVKEKYGSDFIFVTDFPSRARAFYTMKDDNNPDIGKCYDLLFKGVEITSGAQREHRYEKLKENISDRGINPESMNQYLEFFRYGVPAHGGFAIGIARFIARLFDLPSIKEASFLSRGPSRLLP